MTKILLVEDDKSLREIYGVRLLAEGYDIVSAGDGEEALAMAIKERPDLIVSDVMMPKISGFDMLDILRSTTETRDIKVIMMTALSSEDQRLRGEALGADRYLVKSQVGIEDVVRTVHDVLGDIPSAAPTAQQNFGTPVPSALPRQAPVAPPARPVAPQPQYQQPQAEPAPAPQAPVFQPQPAPQPQPEFQQPAPQPEAPQAPVFQPQPQPAPQPQPEVPQQPAAPAPLQPSTLPQPTAPFSSPRPANLGDRIIQPLSHEDRNEPTVDVSSLIEQELHRAEQPAPQPQPEFQQPAPQPEAPQAPVFQPQPQPAPQPQPEVPQPQPTVATPPVAPAAQFQPPQPTAEQPQQ